MTEQKQTDKATIDMIAGLHLGGIYKHYKGKEYLLLTPSRNADDLSWWVVYEAQYANEVSPIWHRPLEEFCGTVMIDGKEVPRFQFTGEFVDPDFNEEEEYECDQEECGCDEDHEEA